MAVNSRSIRSILSKVMTDADRPLLTVLEDAHPDQLAPLLRIAEQKGISVGEAVVMAMRGLLECLKTGPQYKRTLQWLEST